MASANKKFEYIVPRSFRLRQELEFAEKGINAVDAKAAEKSNKPKDPHQGFVSYGLGDLEDGPYETQLSNWNGTIIGPQNTPLGDRIYGVRLKAGRGYPNEPPTLAFVQKIAGLPGVDANGIVNYTALIGKAWNRHVTMYEYLCKVRDAMVQAAKTKQPPPDECYPEIKL